MVGDAGARNGIGASWPRRTAWTFWEAVERRRIVLSVEAVRMAGERVAVAVTGPLWPRRGREKVLEEGL